MELNNITELCEIAYKYGTDKCPQLKHSYTPFYYHLLNERKNIIKKVLEIGVGYYRGMDKEEVIYDPGLNRYMHRGASLYMWRDFFPSAQVYGADVRPEAVFEDSRIKIFQCDERKLEDLEKLVSNTGPDIDLFIDDGSHRVDDQIFLAKNILPLLQKDVIYIIEDVGHSRKIVRELGSEYNYFLPNIPRKWRGGMLLVIAKK